ncbi:DUF4168 domain-containing protein [Aquibaculum arenosum]|uniref:DUF4168 domain-containing protein n=1 Tax=Aquibaculum arenosum TaxID=3032591 RepID=A0ABT5YI97_9PROT|nr:DUF4168 domain-containing protein [Fodinicurvata sp. CAU 1616]MDF2094617.1 DUF4168 domain-containing protein [Fodinicurvata sp. CAU 1616]
MNMPIRTLLAGTAAVALMAGAAFVAPTPVTAQTEMQQQEAPAVDYDTQTLQTYAAAMTEVVEIGERMQPSIAEAESEEEAEEIWVEMQEEMVSAVEQQGMSVDEYNQITQQAQMDPDLAAEINEMVQNGQ